MAVLTLNASKEKCFFDADVAKSGELLENICLGNYINCELSQAIVSRE